MGLEEDRLVDVGNFAKAVKAKQGATTKSGPNRAKGTLDLELSFSYLVIAAERSHAPLASQAKCRNIAI
jgi:hypothetical protein